MKDLASRLALAAALLGTGGAFVACGGGDNSGSSSVSAPTIQALSSSPAQVTGGNVLVAVTSTSASTTMTARLNGTDVSTAFSADPANPQRRVALLSGLTVGDNTFAADNGGDIRTVTLTNYPITGPVFSGPHQTPFICQTSEFVLPDGSKLGAALDADCSIATKITYVYMQTSGTAFVPLPDPTKVPADAASTTTLAGVTMPFIVRVETGTVDRGIYQSAVLFNPTTDSPPTPMTPPKGWNQKLIAVEGFGCPGGWYIQGNAIGNLTFAGFDFSILSIKRLGEGYATFSNTLQHASNDCNAVLESESASMSKEHFIKTMGVPVFTVSAGCSGGSYGSADPADLVPGLFDGILIACTFPDPLAIAFSGSDGHLLTHYFAVTNPTEFTLAQQVAISGYKGAQAWYDAANQAGRTDPVPNRSDIAGYLSASVSPDVPTALLYNPTTNKTGARPDVYDAGKNMYGTDKTTGFALRPFDNVGVQYGLAALNAGTITPTQFLDLNQGIGGFDQDANYVSPRTVGDPGAMMRMQQGGMQLGGNGGLAQIPVFDVSGIYFDDGGYHYQWFHFAFRERLLQANGDTGNHVMWRGNPVPAETAWSTFISWVTAYKADTSSNTQRAKVIADKPAAAVDGCWSSATTFIAETQTLGNLPNTQCNTLFPSWTAPRLIAGGPTAANIPKCTLKPASGADYSVAFSPAELARLSTVFPSGVCDWTQSGNHTGVVPNASFGPSPVNLVFDITKE
jgi:hypothetical protein